MDSTMDMTTTQLDEENYNKITEKSSNDLCENFKNLDIKNSSKSIAQSG